ncbi:hypothetical protein M9Y10_023162 [Tritrichomonas musculus]|uniref:Myb-like DNA-binding domain containing protein n=1 Tax=Tritrichomonas musculus TaxID=1915356 RepID=A0ABR2KXJ0_9EUKA
MAEPPQSLQTNIQQTQAADDQGNIQSNSNNNLNNNQIEISSESPNNMQNNNHEIVHSITTIQQQTIITPIQPIQNSEDAFNPNPQYASFPPNGNFAIQAAATIANQHPQQLQQNTKNKNIIKSNPINLNVNQVLTSISSFQNFNPFNPVNTINGITYGTKKAISRHKFSIDEDNLLRNLVNEHGTTNWRFIADNMVGRNARQCRDRWKNYLMPGIKNVPWTPEEDMLLEEKYAALGSQWARIAKYFPNRTDINVKNRWATRSGRMNKAQPIADLHAGNANDSGEISMKRNSPPPEIINSIHNAIDAIQGRTFSAEVPSITCNLKNDNLEVNNNKQMNEEEEDFADDESPKYGGGSNSK